MTATSGGEEEPPARAAQQSSHAVPKARVSTPFDYDYHFLSDRAKFAVDDLLAKSEEERWDGPWLTPEPSTAFPNPLADDTYPKAALPLVHDEWLARRSKVPIDKIVSPRDEYWLRVSDSEQVSLEGPV
jgi:hypothetical protein